MEAVLLPPTRHTSQCGVDHVRRNLSEISQEGEKAFSAVAHALRHKPRARCTDKNTKQSDIASARPHVVG